MINLSLLLRYFKNLLTPTIQLIDKHTKPDQNHL